MPTNQRAYTLPRPDDTSLISTYGTPVPPTASALLESYQQENYTMQLKHTENLNFSPLLDTKDDLGMRLLLTGAAEDSQNFKLLSLEEVERLKREKSLLRNRIDAHIRKLALESKVREASENLVKLHSQKNKRLSKQADEQFQSAARKVEDLATDLWRLQRREAVIKEQLLEHMAGVLGRNVTTDGQIIHAIPPLDFDEAHLYIDSTSLGDALDLVMRDTTLDQAQDTQRLSKNEDARRTIESVSQELTDTNALLRAMLSGMPVVGPNKDVPKGHSVEHEVQELRDGVSELLRKYAAQQKSLKEDHSQAGFIKQLWKVLQEDSPVDSSESALVHKLSSLVLDSQRLELELEEHNARAKDMEEQHALAMKQLQSEYERELDDAHVELDQLREANRVVEENQANTEVYQKEISSLKAKHNMQLTAVLDELRIAKDQSDELTEKLQYAELEMASITKSRESHQKDLGDLQAELRTRSQLHRTDNESAQQKITSLEELLKHLSTDIAAHRERHEIQERDLKIAKDNHAAEKALSSTKNAEQAMQLDKASSTIAQVNTKLVEVTAQLNSQESKMQEKVDLLQHELDVARDSAARDNAVRVNHQKSQEQSQQDSQQKVEQVSAQMHALRLEHQQAVDQRMIHEESIAKLEAGAAAAQREMGLLRQRNVELTTEVERRLVDTADTVFTQHLQARCELLQTELDSMLVDFEALTRTSVAFESERAKVEDRSDSLMDRVMELEALVAEERVKNLGHRPASNDDGPVSPMTGSNESNATAALRKEFRKLVQEMRAQHAKQTRSDYAEIKRLERLVAASSSYHSSLMADS